MVDEELGCPLALSQRGQASQLVAVASSCNNALGPGAAGWAGAENPPAEYGKGAILSNANC